MILLANDRNKLTSDFVALGRQLADFGRDERSQRAITDAVAGNGWFTAESITSAVTAIREQMLREEPLRQWLARYPEVKSPKNVGIIMAGQNSFSTVRIIL